MDCKAFRATYEGKWDAMLTKCAKCVLKLMELAKGRRRNFILDQVTLFPIEILIFFDEQLKYKLFDRSVLTNAWTLLLLKEIGCL